MDRFRNLVVLSAFLLCAGAPILTGQQQSPDEIVARARDLYFQQGPKVALPEFERALALYQKAGNRRGEAIALGQIGTCYKQMGDYARALDYQKRALAMKQQVGDRLEEGKSWSQLGLIYWNTGELRQAVEALTRSITIAREVADRQLEATALNNLGLVYDEQGDYRRSLEQYRRALELQRAIGFERGESDTLGNTGGVYLLLGQYREAMRYYQQSLAISERLKLKASASQDLGNLALCFLGQGRLPEALAHFDRALLLAREAGLKKEEADWQKGRGSALVRSGRYDQALEEYRQAQQVYEKAGLKRELIEVLSDLGSLHALLGDAASAERDFRRAIELARAIGHARGVTVNLLTLGNIEWRRKRYEEAGALFRDALARAREVNDQAHTAASQTRLALTYRDQGRSEEARREAQAALEAARAAGAEPIQAEALYVLAEAARADGRYDEALKQYAAGEEVAKRFGDPDIAWRLAYGRGQALEAAGRNTEAVAAYQQAVTLIESVRNQLREERFRAGYIEDKYQVYVALVRLLLRMGRAGDAFAFAERLRARGYLDVLNRGVPPARTESRRQAEIELRERIRQLQRAIAAEQGREVPQQRKEALALFSAELVAAERAYQELLDELRANDPEYAAARALAVPSADQVQRRLPAGVALLEYVIADDSVAIFVLTATELRAKTVPLREADLRARVEVLRKLVVRAGTDDWRKPAESLRRVLIEPIEQEGWLRGVERLYLVPHAILHYLPFAALARQGEKGVRFLAEDYVLAYLPAAAALVHSAGGAVETNGATLLAMAPARTRLLFAQREAAAIQEFFPPRRTLLVGSQATESSFKDLADRYRVVHLATHGYFNKFNPLFSGIELEPDQKNDGRLEVHEILALRLKATLVTLSACETGLGSGYFADVPAGDDFVGLTRAFLFAGAPSVLASLWEVNDRSTLKLMRSFYQHLRDGDKGRALAKAQRAMLRNGGSHPYHWAPFVLVGEM